jgi:hypothetical protein
MASISPCVLTTKVFQFVEEDAPVGRIASYWFHCSICRLIRSASKSPGWS